VELDISGNTESNEEMGTAELPVLPTRSFTILQEGSEVE
jgi:hypothetical protein